ncbi:MAG: hypothetical protein K6T91_05840 [Firmicutes bacterium]|nr:hypothetical protein [Bacillota bacterium]
MTKTKISPKRSGLILFLSFFLLGLVIFIFFGWMAGVFSPGKDLIHALTGSPAGLVALFGATLVVVSPIIGLSVWAVDRAFKSAIEKNKR